MSARNGDKARFGKQRKRKMAHRARTRDLREGLPQPVPVTSEASTQAGRKEDASAGAAQDEHLSGSTDTTASSQ